MANIVYMNNGMSGAPQNIKTGSGGSNIALLDACLVNGFGSVTVNSIVVASGVATCTVSGGHQLSMFGSTGPVIRISGVTTPAELNGDWRVTVTDATHFTFTTVAANQTATGTISAKRAPAGFSKVYSGTNKAVYRSNDTEGTRLYLRVDDADPSFSRVRGYEAMSDVDTGTGPFPTDAQLSGGAYLNKPSSTGTAYPWTLFGDGRLFYLFTSNGSYYYNGMVFGDIESYVAGDAYHCLLVAATASGSYLNQIYQMSSTAGSWLARNYSQLGGAIGSARYSHGQASMFGGASQVFPAPADNGLRVWPVEVWDNTSNDRGWLSGAWNPIHNNSVLAHGSIYSNVNNLPGRDFIIQEVPNNGRAALDLTGPWRGFL